MSQEEITVTESKTLKELAEDYIDHLVFTAAKAGTIIVYRKALDLAIGHFGEERKVGSILVPHVGKFFNSEVVNTLPNGKPKAEATVKQIKRVFRQCLQFAKDKGWISNLPIPKSALQHAHTKKQDQTK